MKEYEGLFILDTEDSATESGLHADYERWLEELAPHEPIEHYQHNNTGEDNADAHFII